MERLAGETPVWIVNSYGDQISHPQRIEDFRKIHHRCPERKEGEETMDIIYFDSLEEAERKLRKKEVEHLIVDHELDAGEHIATHKHEANEWVILCPGNGSCNIWFYSAEMNGQQLVELDPKRTKVIFFPEGVAHGFEAITYLSYTVMRDGLK
jgi:hypothetical protein